MTRRFVIVAVLFLLWNLAGDAAYLMQSRQDLGALAASDPASAEAFRAMPDWAWSAYAIAVWGGTAGAIALLLRRRIATWLFVLSLAGIVVQFGWTFTATDLVAQKGLAAVAAFPALVALVAAVEIWWSRRQAAAGVLR